MAVPKKRTSKSKKNSRLANWTNKADMAGVVYGGAASTIGSSTLMAAASGVDIYSLQKKSFERTRV
jgi:hypothetical protein